MSPAESWGESLTAWQAKASMGSSKATQLQDAWTICYSRVSTPAANLLNIRTAGKRISPDEFSLLALACVNPAALPPTQILEVDLIIRAHFPKPPVISVPAVATVDAIGTEATARITFKIPVTRWLRVPVLRSDLPSGTQEGDSLAVEVELDAEGHFRRCVSYQPVPAKAPAARPGSPLRPVNTEPAAWAEYRQKLAIHFGEE